MTEVRKYWPSLNKHAQAYIACFETLAQLALAMLAFRRLQSKPFKFVLPSASDKLAVTHLAGEKNQWADELSRGQLHRFQRRTAGRERISLACLSSPQGNVTLHPHIAAWRDKLAEAQHPVAAP